MIPVRPVIIGRPDLEPVLVAKNQSEFTTMPSQYFCSHQVCLSRWALDETDNERDVLVESKTIFFYQTNPNYPNLTGFILSAFFIDEMNIMLSHYKKVYTSQNGSLDNWLLPEITQQNVYRYEWKLSDEELKEILKNNSIYVYQFNMGNKITPSFGSVYSNIVF